jgi:hypothetical protein
MVSASAVRMATTPHSSRRKPLKKQRQSTPSLTEGCLSARIPSCGCVVAIASWRLRHMEGACARNRQIALEISLVEMGLATLPTPQNSKAQQSHAQESQ